MKTLYTTYNNFAKRLVMSLMVLMTVGVGSVLGAEEVMFPNNESTFNSSWSKSTRTARQTYAASTAAIQLMGQNSGIYGEIYSNNAYTGISAISVKATASNSVSLTLYYSTDKSTWTELSSISLTKSTSSYSSKSFTVTGIPSSAVYLKFRTSASSAYIYSVTVTTASGYAVTYNNGGRGTAPKNTTASSVTLSEITATGYTNTGWKANVDVKNGSNTIKAEELINNGTTVTLSQATTFTAQWTPKQVTITWNANGGIVTPSTSNYIYDGSSVTLPTPTRDGYNFKGWYTSGGTQITDIGTNNKPASDVTYYAQWTEKQLTNYRTSCADPCEQLGDATGLSVQTDYVDNGQTYVKFSWTPANNTKDHATKQVICIGKVGEEKKCTDLEENQVWTADLRSKLSPGEYEWTIQAIGDGENYCDGEVISGPNFTIEEPLTDNCRWVEVTDNTTLEDGDEVVITMTWGITSWALPNDGGTSTPTVIIVNDVEGNRMLSVSTEMIWIVDEADGMYNFYPKGSNVTWLYCTNTNDGVRVGTGENKYFTVVNGLDSDSENNFLYNIATLRYVGVYHSGNDNPDWRCYKLTDKGAFPTNIQNQTLKFYKKTCLPADEYWINYNLSNVTCITNPIPSQIANDGEDLLLEFSANDGYKLPETISVKMGETEIGNDENYCVWYKETGALFIVAELITDNITITIEGCERLATPTNLSVTNITSTSARLSWNAVTNADEYRVCIMDGETQLEELTTTETYVNVMNLKKNSFYTWDVVAEADDYCESQPTAWIEFTTLDVYTVTFNSNGGTAVESQTVDRGSKATKPANPTKTGYTFAGWYTEADTEFSFNTSIESATTLYAKWNANQYTITLRQQWGSGGTETVTVHFNENDFSVSPIIVPTRNGYTFGGYYTAESGAGTQLIDVSGAWLNVSTYIEGGKWVYANNLTLYAKWTQNFTITWMANGQPYHTQTAMMGTTIVKPENPVANEFACDDKVFVGWLDEAISGSTNDEPTFVTDFGTIQANKTYYAVFATVTGTPSNDYNKITDINDLTDGEYVIAYSYDGGTQIVLDNTTKDATKMNASALAPSSNKYTSPNTEYIWQLQKQDDGSYYMYNSSVNKFLYATTSALQLSDNPTKYTISYDNNYSHWKIKLSNDASYYMHGYVSGSTYDFRVSTSGSGNKYRVYLYKNASTAVYSEYVTTCAVIPDPVWGGAEINHSSIKVNCGGYTKLNAADPNGPATISFPAATNNTLTYDINVTASDGFLVSTNKTDYTKYGERVTVSPVQSGANVGTITQNVYVIAVAPAQSDEDFTGTITISGKQIATQTINVTADVTCTQYTLTFNDQGQTKEVQGFAGTSVMAPEPWVGICTEPIQYVFDGWATATVANGTEEYTPIDFSTYTMPDNDTTILYAVYRYAEEGGDPVNGYVKVTEALANWSGDYVIVDDENLFAIKNAYRENTSSNKTLAGETITIENDKVVSPSANIVWTFSKNGNGYTMYSDANKMYAGVTGNSTTKAILSSTTDANSIFTIIFDNETQIAKVSAITYTRCFRYYESGDVKEWRTYDSNQSQYNTGYLYRLSEKTIRYTSSLVCGSIEAENAIVTSTVGQTVKVYVPITLEYSDVASITGTSDNEAFTVVTKNDVAVGESNIEVHYKPTAYVNTANQEETATITLTTSNGATTTFNVTGRCLPETFAIVAKVGNVWYALPSRGLNSETTPVGYPVKVDNNDNPTVVTSLPTKAEWALRNVYKVNGPNDRFAANGENLVFINAENKTLYANNGNANIQTYAEYTNYAANNPDRYEWVPTTEDLTTYTLKNVGRDKNLSINVNATFGTHTTNIATSNLRFLPIETTYTPIDMKVVEWYPTKVLVQTETTLASVSVMVGNEIVANPIVTPVDAKLYEISGLPLKENPTKLLTIKYGELACNKVIPIILSQEEITVADALFSTLTTSVYNYSDLVVRDGAKLTINGIEKTPDKFVNVTIYPTAKIVVPENTRLNVYSLTFIGGISEVYNGSSYELNKYAVPELSLKGTLGKTVTTIDYLMRVDLEQMYSLALPYDVALSDITYGDGSAIELGTQLYVSAYDGAARAQNLGANKNWVYETDFESIFGSATLKAGVGYTISAQPQAQGDKYAILRFPMTKNINSGDTEAAKSVAVTAHGKGMNIADNHKGWNLVANPYMASISGDSEEYSELMLRYMEMLPGGIWQWTGDNQRYVSIPYNDGSGYYQLKFSEAVLQPFKNFFVQVGETGTLDFVLTSRQNAPARYMEVPTVQEVEFELLLSNEKYTDNTGLLIAEQYSPAYEINADLEKLTGSMSVYTIYGGYKLAYNALNPMDAEERIPIGYIVPAVGEYTFELDENVDLEDFVHIYLIDNETGVVIDLIDNTYTFETSVKKSESRFAINVVLRSDAPGTATGMDNMRWNSDQPQKFIYDDKIYILYDGTIYDANGKRVKTIND